MPTFYWVPYFEGKLLNYYQYFALVGSTVVAIIALINYFIYRQLKNCSKPHQQDGRVQGKTKLEKFFYKAAFIFLSLVPLICSATDTINTVFGMLGMMAILSCMVYTEDKATRWVQLPNSDAHLQTSRQAYSQQRTLKKKLLIVAVVSVLVPLFCHRTCLCFYNN